MRASPSRILFCYHTSSSFTQDDLETLGNVAIVHSFLFSAKKAKNVVGLLGLFVQQFFCLLRHIRRSDVVFGWFADYHLILPTFFARLFRKPIVIVLGGYDCIHLPELRYGIYESWWRAPVARFVLRRASLLLPVSPTLNCTENMFSEWPNKMRNGLCVHVPGLNTRVEPIPTGYDPTLWTPGPPARSRSVCTVGLIDSERTFRRKGLDLVLETAALLPEVHFTIVGVSETMRSWVQATYAPGPNVDMKGRVPRPELVATYQAASVYLQLSRAEGMPNVLFEAMMCGCIPVVSDVFGQPDTAGPDGFIVATPEPARIAEAIEKALVLDDSARPRYRQHIVDNFLTTHREERLRAALASVGVAL